MAPRGPLIVDVRTGPVEAEPALIPAGRKAPRRWVDLGAATAAVNPPGAAP